MLALYSRRVNDLRQMAFAHDRLIGRVGVGVGELFRQVPLGEELVVVLAAGPLTLAELWAEYQRASEA